MKSRMAALYWVITGAMIGFGLIGLMTIGFPFLAVGLIMTLVGVWKPGLKSAWAGLVGFGGLPALVFTIHLLDAARSAVNPYCKNVGPNAGRISAPPDTGMVACTYVPTSYYVMFAVFAAIALLGVCLGALHARSSANAA